jgi:hypothetical protein
MIFVILGMHKSGSTLIAQTLHESGINIIDERSGHDSIYERLLMQKKDKKFVDEMSKNTNLFFERQSVVNINQQIIVASKNDSIPVNKESSLYVPQKISIQTTDSLRKQMELVISYCNEKYGDWGMKDPRTSLTYKLWEPLLPPHKIIVIYRSYKGFMKRYKLHGWRQLNIYRLWKVLRAWAFYNQCIAEYLCMTNNPYMVMDYDTFMKEPNEFYRLSEFVGKPLVDVRNINLFRNHKDANHNSSFLENLVSFGLKGKPIDVLAHFEALRKRHVY